MSSNNYKPVPRVRMTLTQTVQLKVLRQLFMAFGIMETQSSNHEITCYPSDFAYFMSLLAKMESPPTMKQLKVEYVDIRKNIVRTSVSQRSYAENVEDTVEDSDATIKEETPETGEDKKTAPIPTAWVVEGAGDISFHYKIRPKWADRDSSLTVSPLYTLEALMAKNSEPT